jgi:hypothetical protein
MPVNNRKKRAFASDHVFVVSSCTERESAPMEPSQQQH